MYNTTFFSKKNKKIKKSLFFCGFYSIVAEQHNRYLQVTVACRGGKEINMATKFHFVEGLRV